MNLNDLTVDFEITMKHGDTTHFIGSLTVPVDVVLNELPDADGTVHGTLTVQTGEHGTADGTGGTSRGGGARVGSDEPVEMACAWSNFRKDYGASADETAWEHAAFMAGWNAAMGRLEVGGPLR